jgi:hypothetical protein
MECPDCGLDLCPWNEYGKWLSAMGEKADQRCLAGGVGGRDCHCYNCEVAVWWEEASPVIQTFLYGLIGPLEQEGGE